MVPRINFRFSGFAMGVPIKTATDADGKDIDVVGMSSKEFVDKIRAGELQLCLEELGDCFQTGEGSQMVVKDVSAYVCLEDVKELEDKLDDELKTLGED
jgi:hypothetical protein